MSTKQKDELKSEITSSKPRDEQGKFINPPDIKTAKNPFEKFLLSHTGNYKDQDDILDIRVGNPLGKIVKLLEEIKNQKAFSFTLKGSLGIAGVVLALSVFGLFGGSQILCDKGTQSQIGMVKILNAREIYSKPVPFLSYILELVTPSQKYIKNRMILVKNDNTTIYIPHTEDDDIVKFANSTVIITGNYNSCSQTLAVNDSSSIETFVR